MGKTICIPVGNEIDLIWDIDPLTTIGYDVDNVKRGLLKPTGLDWSFMSRRTLSQSPIQYTTQAMLLHDITHHEKNAPHNDQ